MLAIAVSWNVVPLGDALAMLTAVTVPVGAGGVGAVGVEDEPHAALNTAALNSVTTVVHLIQVLIPVEHYKTNARAR
jgi:hypothetical protein